MLPWDMVGDRAGIFITSWGGKEDEEAEDEGAAAGSGAALGAAAAGLVPAAAKHWIISHFLHYIIFSQQS